MFSWLASLFVLLLHGNSPRIVTTAPLHSTVGQGVHAMDSGSTSTNPGSGFITDGSGKP